MLGQNCDADERPVLPPAGLAVHHVDCIKQELLAACQLSQPAHLPLSSLDIVEGRNLIVLLAPGGRNRPHKAPGAVSARNTRFKAPAKINKGAMRAAFAPYDSGPAMPHASGTTLPGAPAILLAQAGLIDPVVLHPVAIMGIACPGQGGKPEGRACQENQHRHFSVGVPTAF
jgi:hypothetical protein